MKKQETTPPQMDEIIFEKRNKMYGAYILRKMYNKEVNKALLLSIAILIAGLAYPLVSSYRTIIHGTAIGDDGPTTYMPNLKPPAERPVLPTLPPPKDPIVRPRFVAPYVTTDEVIETTGLPFQEDFTNTPNEPVDLNVGQSDKKQTVVIEVPEEKQETIILAEEMPFFPGGDAERLIFLSENIKYPQQATELGIQGTVYLQFVVDSKGNITDVKILRGIGGGCEEEAMRVIKMMPQWHPGRQNGKAVRVLYTMPVNFKLQS